VASLPMAGRHARIAGTDSDTAELIDRLLSIALRGLPTMYRPETDEFAFTRARRDAVSDPGGTADLETELRGTSLRYAAIVALGAHWLPDRDQRSVLGGHSAAEYVGLLASRLTDQTSLGDAALVCWAAAQSHHPLLADALALLHRLDVPYRPAYVVEAAWVLAALAAARRQADVESHLEVARARLLGSAAPGSPLFPHQTAPGLVKGLRSHVACFADQVYPIQALARLHHSGNDPMALARANACAAQICRLQGEHGQWWWHYDARTGGVIEGYPVYAVHQHAMGPMALLDLADVGGDEHGEAIRRGLRWLLSPPEVGPNGPSLLLDDAGLTWRKVYRGDPRKAVRGLHAATTRVVPGLRIPGAGALFRPRYIDSECRPYEFGWLLFTWLGGIVDRVTHTGAQAQDGLTS
jgi:hypothetical protein